MIEDLTQRAARHQPRSDECGQAWCVPCIWSWPCDAAVFAAALTAAQAQLAAAQTRIAVLERVAELARACLDETTIPYSVWEQRIADCQSAFAALDADA